MTGLERLFKRRFPLENAYTIEQGKELSLLSRAISRQIGLLIDRKGRVGKVIVGDTGSLLIPELSRSRSSEERLRGLRLLHTHLTPEGLTQDDLMDLLFLRLDAIIVLTVNPDGHPVQWQQAHLLPSENQTSPYSIGPMLPWDQPLANVASTTSAIEDELTRIGDDSRISEKVPRALLVSVGTESRQIQEHNLNELEELAKTCGLQVVGRMCQRIPHINPRLIMGKGKMTDLEILALQKQADILVFDGELLPTQLHNLTDITERKVIDRTQLILDIFAQHAVTQAGKLQVELAQLKYTQPRLAGKNRAMDRLMGGIGGRGPGETKLETDRRRIRERMSKIRNDLDALRRQRAFTRARRSRQGIPVVSLVGYTNVGKSTLLNTLTKSQVGVANKLFATLDPTTRRLRFPTEREIILTDTVGFIRNLPDELVNAFQATLEELASADLLVHVADASHPDVLLQISAVENILDDMEMASIPRLLVMNKCDEVPLAARAELGDIFPQAIQISAATGDGLSVLQEEMENLLPKSRHLPMETMVHQAGNRRAHTTSIASP